jgi:DNA-binding SARP family transcriptional activator/Tfp pilus assembly protein PilF/TolB-like protein
MLYLRTLGGLSLENEGKPCTGAAGQRAPLAMLAFIAIHENGATRDRIAATFWPESDSERAHGSLKQALYSLRRDAGSQDLLIGTSSLKLNSQVITCDAVEFNRAMASKELDRAIDIYSGDFLDGIHLTGNGEFERWVDGERAMLATEFASALENLAIKADEKGDLAKSVTWWRRLAISDPMSTRIARHYITALALSRDKNAAIEYAELHQRMLMTELDAGPDPGITQLINDIKAGRLQSIEPSPNPKVPAIDSSPIERLASEPRNSRGMRVGLIGVLGTAMIVLAGLLWQSPTKSTLDPALKSIALLPCVHAQDDSATNLGDRWSEELINKLVSVGELRPKSFLSTQRYRNQSKSANEIGRELNAASLLRCRVSEDSMHIRLTLQLIRVRDDEVVWSHQYERSFGIDGINSIQSEAAIDIARVFDSDISTTRATAIGRPMTQDSTALRFYRLGRHLYNKGGPGDMRRSAEYFRKAIERDSTFAMAYVSLADAIGFVGEGENRQATEWQPETERYLRKALQLDPSIPEAHSLLALYYSEFVYDTVSAVREHRQALELNPNSVDAHLWYGMYLFDQERPQEALVEYKRALALDPMLPLARMHIARVYVFTGQYARAKPYLEQAKELYPELEPLAHLHATGLISEGLKDSAIAVLDRFEKNRAAGTVAEISCWNGYLYGIAGRPAITQRIKDRVMAAYKTLPVDATCIAALEIGLGHKDSAITWLQRAYAERSSELRYALGPHVAFRSIRMDPRFQELRRKVGLHGT